MAGYFEPWNAGTDQYIAADLRAGVLAGGRRGLALLPAAGGECSLELRLEFLDLARPLA
jgi:hypothetical protein